MTAVEFIKMFNDIGKSHHIKGKTIEPAKTCLPDGEKIYGFGYKKPNGYFANVWEFKTLVKIVHVCDWLDYYGFDRPKWTPR